jgi:hypothetical protein
MIASFAILNSALILNKSIYEGNTAKLLLRTNSIWSQELKQPRQVVDALLWCSVRILAALPTILTKVFVPFMNSIEGCMVNPENNIRQPRSKSSFYDQLLIALNGIVHQEFLQFIIHQSVYSSTPYNPGKWRCCKANPNKISSA